MQRINPGLYRVFVAPPVKSEGRKRNAFNFRYQFGFCFHRDLFSTCCRTLRSNKGTNFGSYLRKRKLYRGNRSNVLQADLSSPQQDKLSSYDLTTCHKNKSLQNKSLDSLNITRDDSFDGNRVNLFDAQYFSSAFNDESEFPSSNRSEFSDDDDFEDSKDLNEFDNQYFSSLKPFSGSFDRHKEMIKNEIEHSIPNHVIEIKEKEAKRYPYFGDTSLSEGQILKQYLQKKSHKQTITEHDKLNHSMTLNTSNKLAEIPQENPFTEEWEHFPESSVSLSEHSETSRRKSGRESQQKKTRMHRTWKNLELDQRPKAGRVYETSDPDYPASNVPCSGCGAYLHCQDTFVPGFLPSAKFKPLFELNQLKDVICERCWQFEHFKSPHEISVNADDYAKIISVIYPKKAFLLIMVDLLDFPCSIIPNLKDLIGNRKKIGIVGNKFDVIPKDSKDYEKCIKDQLLETCISEGVCTRSQVTFVELISAKSGYNIENLISKMHQNWGSKGDIYLLGTANIGKSSLFNKLLCSDLIQGKAAWVTKPATVSRWPGTTLNLLKFPLLDPRNERMVKREARLKTEKKLRKVEAEKLKLSGDVNVDKTSYVKGDVGQSFLYIPPELRGIRAEDAGIQFDEEDERIPFSSRRNDPFFVSHPNEVKHTHIHNKPRTLEERTGINIDTREYKYSNWFYDTPGVVHDRQIFTHLTLAELNKVMPSSIISPRTLILKPKQTIFLGGLGRLDFVEGTVAIYFTIFASHQVPVRVTTIDEADDFYKKNAGERHFRVPIGGEERMKTFPKLEPKYFEFEGIGWKKSTADILLSSIGWAAITAGNGVPVHIRAYTPNGQGLYLRQPALLPYAVNFRGKRIPKEPFYRVDVQKFMRLF